MLANSQGPPHRIDHEYDTSILIDSNYSTELLCPPSQCVQQLYRHHISSATDRICPTDIVLFPSTMCLFTLESHNAVTG